MDSDQELLKVQEARQLAHDAVCTLQTLDDLLNDLLIDIDQSEGEDQRAKCIHDEIREVLNAVEGMAASIDVWGLRIGELLPEDDDGGIGVAAE